MWFSSRFASFWVEAGPPGGQSAEPPIIGASARPIMEVQKPVALWSSSGDLGKNNTAK